MIVGIIYLYIIFMLNVVHLTFEQQGHMSMELLKQNKSGNLTSYTQPDSRLSIKLLETLETY